MARTGPARALRSDLSEPTSLQIFLQASATCVQLLFRQREGPFPGKLREVEIGKLPLEVLVQNSELPVPLGAQLPAGHVHIVHLQWAEMNIASV